MATIYLAFDNRLRRFVAIKSLHQHLAVDTSFTKRFIQEAFHIAQLQHPQIVSVYDYNRSDDSTFIVMELIVGSSLRQTLREYGPMPPHAALSTIKQTLLGLKHAHKQGILHRDIKPENILISHEGSVKLADFGLGKAYNRDHQSLTQADKIIGTAAYLAPEQIEHKKTGPYTDLYAIGVTLFEMLTNTPPYKSTNLVHLIHEKTTQSFPLPSSRRRGIPHPIDMCIALATHIEPYQRYPSCDEMLNDVDAILAHLGNKKFTPFPSLIATKKLQQDMLFAEGLDDYRLQEKEKLPDNTQNLQKEKDIEDPTSEATPSVELNHFDPYDVEEDPYLANKNEFGGGTRLLLLLAIAFLVLLFVGGVIIGYLG